MEEKIEEKIYEYIVEKYNIFSKIPQSKKLICFTTAIMPEIGFFQYLKRLFQYTYCSKSCFYVALIYIDKIVKKHNIKNIQYDTIYKLYFVALLMAIKWNDDNYLSNTYYSEICGVKKEELLSLQIIFFELLDYNAYVDEKNYLKIKEQIDIHLPFATMTV